MTYQKTLGLEVHAQIASITKLFSRSLFQEDAEPNANVGFLDAGLPGTLPIPNKNAILLALKTALALNMHINEISVFDRKHYFYQDLPLGYQITQFYRPIGLNGYLECSFGRVNINRLHIECDAGKSVYHDGHTYVDLNRAGVPLMEIVTDPDFKNEDEVVEFLKELRLILLSIQTCRCDLEKGNLRADVNLSLSNNESLGTRVEIKNLNSFSSIRKAVQYEAALQENILKNGGSVSQETKLFDPINNTTKSMRSKEDAVEYMYFPDPDLLPIYISEDEIQACKQSLPKLPMQVRAELQAEGVAREQSYTLTDSLSRYRFFMFLCENLSKKLIVKISNWICSELLGKLAKLNISLEDFLDDKPWFKESFLLIIKACEEESVTRAVAKKILDKVLVEKLSFEEVVKKYNFLQKVEFNLSELVAELLDSSPNEVEKYKNGKGSIVMFFVGNLMKVTKGQCDANLIKEFVEIELKKRC